MIDSLRQDVIFAVRGLRRSPGLSATILLMYALGLGVNAALFTVMDRVFFQAPPGVADPGSVRRLVQFSRGQGNVEYPSDNFTTKDATELRAAAAGAAEIEGYDAVPGRTIAHDPHLRIVAYATQGFFRFAGVRPYRGRFFAADENRIGDPRNLAVLSYDYWRRGLGADPAVIGRTVRVDTALYTIIGVAPQRFEGMDLDAIDLWAPLAALPPGLEGSPLNGDFDILQLFARISTAADQGALRSRLNVPYRRNRSFVLERDSTIRLELEPLLQARSAIKLGSRNDRNLAVLIRLGGVALVVLLVAVINVASLLLMRAVHRRREISIRVALGISRSRLAAQLAVESVALALLGSAVALWIAWLTGSVLRTVLLADIHWTASVIDERVVAFTMIAALVAGAAAGLAPMSVALRRNVMAALKSGAADAGRAKSTGRAALLVTQTALCLLMLAAAGAFVESLRRATTLDLGFDADHLITFQLFRIDPDVATAAIDRVRVLPGVASVSRSDMDIRGDGTLAGVRLSTGDSNPVLSSPAGGFVDIAFLAATGIRVIAGRFFNQSDALGSEPVAVINETMANAYWPQRRPIGDCFEVSAMSSACRRIVGVVSAVRWDLTGTPAKTYYMPEAQAPPPFRRPTMIAVRTRERASAAAAAQIRAIVEKLPGANREYPPAPRLVSERLEPQLRPWRIAALSFLVCGVLALVAAGGGIYGLVGYDVAERTHEFGVRLTLGATAASILQLVVQSGLRIIAIGLMIGTAVAVVAGRLIQSL
ncbi:MAG: ABC transporter permease, partial [Gemmatimonadaceae bacterium]